MEVNNITMTGLARAMSDLDAKDGELSVSHNIINDHGAMRPIWVPEDVMTLQGGEELVYVHRTAEYKNYIVSDSDGFHFFTDNDSERKPIKNLVNDGSKVKFASIGNTLIATSGRGLEYILYKDGDYKYLGQKPPELDMSFSLVQQLS